MTLELEIDRLRSIHRRDLVSQEAKHQDAMAVKDELLRVSNDRVRSMEAEIEKLKDENRLFKASVQSSIAQATDLQALIKQQREEIERLGANGVELERMKEAQNEMKEKLADIRRVVEQLEKEKSDAVLNLLRKRVKVQQLKETMRGNSEQTARTSAPQWKPRAIPDRSCYDSLPIRPGTLKMRKCGSQFCRDGATAACNHRAIAVPSIMAAAH